MRKRDPSRSLLLMTWLFMIPILCVLLLSAHASAITESDKGTIVRLPDDAYLVPEPFVYEVKENDNLHWLAAKFYGDARQWVRIHQANREQLRHPSVLRIGQQLWIPPNR